MKKIIRILPFLLFVLLLDRFFFLPGRMDGNWQYQKGYFFGDPISFDQIDIINNFELKISESTQKTKSCYLLGCYFGKLYLLDKETLNYSKYSKFEGFIFLD